jgi:uncharacterized OB-fold protein
MEIPRHWRLRQQRYGLVGEECQECGNRVFPPKAVCPECRKGGLDTKNMTSQNQGEFILPVEPRILEHIN